MRSPRGAALAALTILLAASLPACRRPEPLLAISGPRDFLSFEVRDGTGGVLWKIESQEPRQVAELTYGHVPPGFIQSAPAADQPPRALVPGEEITAVSVTRRRIFTHEAWAEGPGSLSIRSGRMALRPPAPPPTAAPSGDR